MARESVGSSTPSMMQDSPEAITIGRTTRGGMKYGGSGEGGREAVGEEPLELLPPRS